MKSDHVRDVLSSSGWVGTAPQLTQIGKTVAPAILVLVVLCATTAVLLPQTPGGASERQFVPIGEQAVASGQLREDQSEYWIAAISANQYAHASSLHNCIADAAAFTESMKRACSIPDDNILTINDDAEHKPTGATIVEQLSAFAARPSQKDVVILYFAMHGGQHNGKTYLLPSDYDPKRGAASLIDLRWLRDLLTEQMRAQTVVVFFDVCHSGGFPVFNADNITAASTRSIKVVFDKTPTESSSKMIYVLTSCDEQEASIEMKRIKHGIFTYWLLQGLQGAADANGDACLTMDELFHFVKLRVPRTASRARITPGVKAEQNPQRFLCGKKQGDVKLFHLQPRGVGECLQQVGDLVHHLLDDQFQSNNDKEGPRRVSVMEFSTKVGDQRELRGPIGSFGAISRELVERRLIDLTTSGPTESVYRVAGQAAAHTQLRDVNLKQLIAGEKVPTNPNSNDGVDAIVTGEFNRRGNSGADQGVDRVQLEITIYDLRNAVHIARFSQTILVNKELWCLLGNSQDSVQLAQQCKRTPAPCRLSR